MRFQDIHIHHSSHNFQFDQLEFKFIIHIAQLFRYAHHKSLNPELGFIYWCLMCIVAIHVDQYQTLYRQNHIKPSQHPQVTQQAHLQPSTFDPPVSLGAAPVLALVIAATDSRDSKTYITSQYNILSTDNAGEEGLNSARQAVKVVSSNSMTNYQLIWDGRGESYYTGEGSCVGGDRGTNS
jgi:hypothetical protein